MKRKLFLGKGKGIFLSLIFLFLLVLPIVEAQPPFAEEGAGSFTEGYFVEYTPLSVYENSQNVQINAHVFNISNGFEIDNSTTICSFSLFDNTGDHVISNINMTYDLVSEDWEYTILGGNFTRNGDYAYLVDCQDNTNFLGGFVAIEFKITPTGIGDLTQFYWLILAISIVILVLGFWLKDPWIVIFGTFGLYFVGLYILINGIVGIKDMVTTWAIGLIILAIAAYISIKSAGETLYG